MTEDVVFISSEVLEGDGGIGGSTGRGSDVELVGDMFPWGSFMSSTVASRFSVAFAVAAAADDDDDDADVTDGLLSLLICFGVPPNGTTEAVRL